MNTSVAATKPTWTQKGIVLRFREQSPSIDFVFTGVDGFRRHKTGRQAALLSHYGFLSVFPLLAVMTTILGFVLQDRPKLQKSIVNSAFANIPIIGTELQNNSTEIKGSFAVLIVGLATSLWAGTKCFVSAQYAMNDIWEVPEDDRPKLAASRGRALLAIVVIGSAQIASGIVSGIIGVGGVSWLNRTLLAVAALIINIVVLLLAYRVLTARPLTRRQLLPGAIFAGVAFSILQVVGGALVSRSLKNASAIYGTFATVIALLAWLSLHAMVALIGVEANAALDHNHRQSRARSTVTADDTASAEH